LLVAAMRVPADPGIDHDGRHQRNDPTQRFASVR
jgi:hypothetical protein